MGGTGGTGYRLRGGSAEAGRSGFLYKAVPELYQWVSWIGGGSVIQGNSWNKG